MSASAPSGLPLMPLDFTDPGDALKLIVVPPARAASNRYTTGPLEAIKVEAVTVDIDTTTVGGFTTVSLSAYDPNGLLLASVGTGAEVVAGLVCQVTFAPDIPDTFALGGGASPFNLQAAMPELTLSEGDELVIATVDGVSLVGELRLWVEDLNAGKGSSAPLPTLAVFGVTAGS